MAGQLNTFTRALREVCRTYLFEEKWLIAPTLRVGRQWLDRVALAGSALLNVHVVTLRRVAVTLAMPELEQRGLVLLRGPREELLMARLWEGLKATEAPYLSQLQGSQGLIRQLQRVLADLRMAGLGARELGEQATRFEAEAKGRELQQLLADYEAALQSERFADYAEVLRSAAERLRREANALRADVLLLLPADLQLGALERQLWLAVAEEQRTVLPVDELEAASDEPTDAGLLRWVLRPHEAPPPRGDGSVAIFRAVGEVNEVREVLRQCLAQGLQLDQVELLHTDAETYVPLVFEVVSEIVVDEKGTPPITFAEGLPVSYFRPGRALLGWLSWIRAGFAPEVLAELLQDDLLQLGADAPDATRLSSRLRQLPLGAGRPQYARVLEGELARRGPEGEDEGQRQRELLTLQRLVLSLLECAPPATEREPLVVLEAAARFVEEHVRWASEHDAYSRRKLLREIRDQLSCISAEERPPASFDVWAWLAALPAHVTVGGMGPKPGCLHVAGVLGGGHSGRQHTFVVGLDDGRFPAGSGQDPLLLDSERHQLSAELPTASSRLSRQLESVAHLFARLRGQVTLSSCCRGLAEDREGFPSPVLLAACRLLRADREGELSTLLASLPPPVCFAPSAAERCSTAGEWWLWRLCSCASVGPGAQELVGQHYPHLGQGQRAARARASAQFTEFDGYVPEAGLHCDPTQPHGLVLSASALERFGRCPLEFFWHDLLGIKPLDEPGPPDGWLSPPVKGSVLHEVFRAFMAELRRKGHQPCYARDRERLLAILEQQLRRQREVHPPLTEELLERDKREMQQSAEIFLREEERWQEGSVPLYFEVAIGCPSNARGSVLDCSEPVTIELGESRAVRARGMIDRIDRLADDERAYLVWDYKTGSSRKYRTRDPFAGGRMVQSALYLALAQARLRQRVAPEATVTRFGYVFPSPREYGRRIEWSAAQLAAGLGVVDELCRVLAAGCFPLSSNREDLERSPYAAAMGPLERAVAAVRAKLSHPSHAGLQRFRQLRSDELDD